jgi:hypothetical protein
MVDRLRDSQGDNRMLFAYALAAFCKFALRRLEEMKGALTRRQLFERPK